MTRLERISLLFEGRQVVRSALGSLSGGLRLRGREGAVVGIVVR